MLKAVEVTKHYGHFRALDGVSLDVKPGEFVSIIGPNGAGKSTLINVLTGLLHPTSGSVKFKGNDIRGVGPVRLAQMGMARSFQLVSIFPLLTVLEILQVAVLSRRGRGMQLFKSLSRDSEVRDEAIEVATVFRLQEKLHVQSAALPQGDKKLLDVASAFALRPEVILLDEPTSGVSTSDKHFVMEILVQAAKEIGIKSIIQVEHDMDIVFCYSDRIIALHQGKVLADTTPSGIWDDKDVVTTVVGRRLSWG